MGKDGLARLCQKWQPKGIKREEMQCRGSRSGAGRSEANSDDGIVWGENMSCDGSRSGVRPAARVSSEQL